MKLRIKFDVNEGQEVKKVSRTFSNLDDALTNDELKNFANAYIKLSETDSYSFEKITEEEFADEGFKVVANLPYYVTTPIIEKLLLSKVNLISITVMVQKEVAKRLAAQPGNKDYGSLSVFINYYTDCKYKFQVPSSVFMPKPNVDSAVVNLKMKEREDLDTDFLFKIVRAAFTTRRKTLLNSFSNSGLPYSKDDIKRALELSGIDGGRRAETLSLEEFIILSVNFKSVG